MKNKIKDMMKTIKDYVNFILMILLICAMVVIGPVVSLVDFIKKMMKK